MIHKDWKEKETIKTIKCIHTDAKKFTVSNMLTPGREYPVKNETAEFYFIIDNSNRIAGYKKDYFSQTVDLS